MGVSKSPFIAFQIPTIRLLAISLFLAQTSNQMQTVAINWHMYELTHSPLSLGLLGLSGFLPILSLSLVGGTLVDRFNKKTVLTIAQLVLALNAFLLFITTIFHIVNPTVLYSIFALISVVAVFSLPARQAMLPNAVPKEYLLNAVSIMNTIFQITVIVGPAIAGLLIAVFKVQSVYLISTIGFLLSMAFLFVISLKQLPNSAKVPFSISSIKEGITFVFKSPLIYSTMLLDFFATFFASANTLMPVFAKDILHVGPKGLGFLYAAPAIGALITGVYVSAKHRLNNQGKLMLFCIFLYGLATVGFGFSKIFILSLIFLAISGSADMVSAVIRNTLRQVSTPDHLRGRMTAINMNFFLGGPYLGEIEAGIAASILGTPLSVAVGGIATILFTFAVTTFVPKLRNYKGHEIEV